MTNDCYKVDLAKEFAVGVKNRIADQEKNIELKRVSNDFNRISNIVKYSYNFEWLGRPIIQYPQDICAMQELIYQTRPDLIVETGIAHGGSLIFYASMLLLLDYEDAVQRGQQLDPQKPGRMVLGVDVDIRKHNQVAIDAHPMRNRLVYLEGSSIDPNIFKEVRSMAENYERVLVCLDSNHTHQHVLSELEAYATLTSVGSYCVVFDTIINEMPEEAYPDRPWGPDNNPKTAIEEFLVEHPEFVADRTIDNKIQISVCSGGYLKRIAN